MREEEGNSKGKKMEEGRVKEKERRKEGESGRKTRRE